MEIRAIHHLHRHSAPIIGDEECHSYCHGRRYVRIYICVKLLVVRFQALALTLM